MSSHTEDNHGLIFDHIKNFSGPARRPCCNFSLSFISGTCTVAAVVAALLNLISANWSFPVLSESTCSLACFSCSTKHLTIKCAPSWHQKQLFLKLSFLAMFWTYELFIIFVSKVISCTLEAQYHGNQKNQCVQCLRTRGEKLYSQALLIQPSDTDLINMPQEIKYISYMNPVIFSFFWKVKYQFIHEKDCLSCDLHNSYQGFVWLRNCMPIFTAWCVWTRKVLLWLYYLYLGLFVFSNVKSAPILNTTHT